MQEVFSFFPRYDPITDYNPAMSKLGRPAKKEYTEIGARIAAAREQANLSQIELAEKMGVSQQMIAKWERRSDNIQSGNLVKLAKILSISSDELLGLKDFSEPRTQLGNTFEKRLYKKIKEVSELGPNEKRQIMQQLDMILENNRLKQKQAS